MKSKWIFILIVALCMSMTGCGGLNLKNQEPTRIITQEEKASAVWLNAERAEDFSTLAKDVRKGKVVISSALDKAMPEYPSDTVFAVAVCFSAMVSETELEQLSQAERSERLNEVFETASQGCKEMGILTDYPKGTCEEYRFFYAYGTEEQFRNLSCKRDTALYVAATYQYK